MSFQLPLERTFFALLHLLGKTNAVVVLAQIGLEGNTYSRTTGSECFGGHFAGFTIARGNVDLGAVRDEASGDLGVSVVL